MPAAIQFTPDTEKADQIDFTADSERKIDFTPDRPPIDTSAMLASSRAQEAGRQKGTDNTGLTEALATIPKKSLDLAVRTGQNIADLNPLKLYRQAFNPGLDASKPLLQWDVTPGPEYRQKHPIAAGVIDWAQDASKAMSSPEVLEQLAVTPIPGVGEAVTANFLSQMAVNAPEQAAEFGKKLGEGDVPSAIKALGNYAAGVAGPAVLAKGALPEALTKGDVTRLLSKQLRTAPIDSNKVGMARRAVLPDISPPLIQLPGAQPGELPKEGPPNENVPTPQAVPIPAGPPAPAVVEEKVPAQEPLGPPGAPAPEGEITPPVPATEPEAKPAAPKAITPTFSEQMKAAPDADAGRAIIGNHAEAIAAVEKSLGLPHTVGKGGSGVGSRGFSTVKPREWQKRIAEAKKIDPVKAQVLSNLIKDGQDMEPAWKVLLGKSLAQYGLSPEGKSVSKPATETAGAVVKSTRPIPTVKEAQAAGMTIKDWHPIIQYDVNQKVLETGRLPNGKKAKPDDLAETKAEQDKIVADWNAAHRQPAPAPAQTEKGPGEAPKTMGFGRGASADDPPSNPEAPAVPPTTPAELQAVQVSRVPGLDGLRTLLMPSSKSPGHLRAAELLGSFLGPMHRRAEAAATALKTGSRQFDKLGLDRADISPTDNPGIKFMSDMSQGREMSGWMSQVAQRVASEFQKRVQLLEEAGSPLQTVRKNYFPGLWTRESRMAFNAAIQTAIERRILPENFDPASTTPAQREAVRSLVNEYIGNGTASDKDALNYLTRRPLAGKESFRKQKVFADIMDAAEFGLRPISNNPIDLVKLKLAEMDRSIMAHQYFKALKERGEHAIITPYEEVPEHWVKMNDKYGTIYGPPTVKVSEHVDKAVYNALVETAKSLGISHERLMRFPPGKHSRALGLSYTGQDKILSKFGTETSVIAHEVGHQLDEKYDLWNNLLRTEGKGGQPGKGFRAGRSELRNIADLTERGKYSRKKEEKIAQVMEAYIHAPEKMQEVAPRVFAWFDAFIKGTPELKAFADIKPGLSLKKLTGEKYVGLPILGYRIVPETTGDILNNYLSSSLYNNKYLGPLYKAWMSTANVLNQAQLGLGSAFHAGFTTVEAQVSQNAEILKDIYGVARGNRSVNDLAQRVGAALIAGVKTPIAGDVILNAWRHPEGQMSPRVRDIVRAAELAGAGFKMERGLETENATKMLRAWYSGKPLIALAHSPVAISELAMKPIMEYLVPHQKAGVFAELAGRIIDQHPGVDLEKLTPQFRQAWNRVDARLGQVRYDRLFANNISKNVIQFLVRAPGWSGGTIAELGGAFPDAAKFFVDWAKNGRVPDNIPDRTAYLASLLLTVGAVNAALTYAMSGQKPQGLDYLAFWDGTYDQQHRKNRWLIPSYVKDLLAYARHPGETLSNKSHPIFSMLGELSRNKDYYGVEIFHPDDSTLKHLGQAGKYVARQFEPFWIRGERQTAQRGGTLGRQIAPYFGVMPAPLSVTQTPAENLARELLLQQMPIGARTQEQADKSKAKNAANTEPYLPRTLKKLSAVSAVRVYEKANEEERAQIDGLVMDKITRSKTLSDEDKQKLLQNMQSR